MNQHRNGIARQQVMHAPHGLGVLGYHTQLLSISLRNLGAFFINLSPCQTRTYRHKKGTSPDLEKFSSDQTRKQPRDWSHLYILQENLFFFEELQKLESGERLLIFFGTLDLRLYSKELTDPSPRGADRHCRQGILRALLAAPRVNIDTFTGLRCRVDMDLRFRYQCGLRLIQQKLCKSAHFCKWSQFSWNSDVL